MLAQGAYIERDFTFTDVKFYDVIVGGNREEKERQQGDMRDYSDAEYEFGRENLEKMPTAFVQKLQKLLKNMQSYLSNPALQEESRRELLEKQKRLEGVLSGEIK